MTVVCLGANSGGGGGGGGGGSIGSKDAPPSLVPSNVIYVLMINFKSYAC